MRILVSGSTGMVGSALVKAMSDQGHEVVRLVRPGSKTAADDGKPVEKLDPELSVLWDPPSGSLGAGADGAEAVVHLAGASIAGGRWTAARKRVLRDSRVAATEHLVGALGKLSRPPRIFIAASAIGYYGDRGDEELTETSAPGADFLAQSARDWEGESGRASTFGARVAILRFGVVLAKNGGALPQMVFPFRLGVGGRIGSGRQWMSWVTLEDVVGAIRFAIEENQFSGPVNVVSPQPVRNAEFAKQLGRVLHRPALFPTPGFVLRLALGEMADSLLLSSQRVLSSRLQQMGYRFQQTELKPALAAVLR
jgi:uncharacterized protein (TIGR01777 family)